MMPLSRRVTVCLQMLEGLAFLHAKDIAHRDIKPDNMFLVNGSDIKIGDFGLARISRKAAHGTSATTAGQFMGSPPYVAPERWVNFSDTDWQSSDQYAAGVTIFELLSAGEMALIFGTTLASCCEAHQSGHVYSLRIPELCGRAVESVDEVIRRMLAKAPQQRYPDIAACKLELTAALVQEDVWREHVSAR
jgi:serine/threonine-protein kinase